MPGRQARIIAPVQLDALLQHVRGRKQPCFRQCRLLLSSSKTFPETGGGDE